MAENFTITVCSSGGGGNFQALVEARSRVGFSIDRLVVDRECGAIKRAESAGIPVSRIKNSSKTLSAELNKVLLESTNLVVLAGFFPIIPREVCDKWKGNMINTHPSLLPKFGGKGMYGVKVQEAVMKAKEQYAGCTIHYVNSKIDGGEIILQKAIEVDYHETPWQLGGRVFEEETKLLVEAISLLKYKRTNLV